MGREGGREGGKEKKRGALLPLLFPRIVEDTPILYPKREYYPSEHKEEPGPEPKPQDKPQPKSTGKSLQSITTVNNAGCFEESEDLSVYTTGFVVHVL